MLRIERRLLVLLLLAWCCCPAPAEPRADRCVILVTIDGLANFYLDDPLADMPTIHKLAHEGAQAQGMVSVFPTVTWPNHVALVTGATAAKTGVVGNNYFDRRAGKPVALIPISRPWLGPTATFPISPRCWPPAWSGGRCSRRGMV